MFGWVNEDIFERLKRGEPVDPRTDRGFIDIIRPEGLRTKKLLFRIGQLEPGDPGIRALFEEIFEGRLPASSNIAYPSHIDRGKAIEIGENCWINEGFTTVSTGSISIGNDCMIAPNVMIATTNHDKTDRRVLLCKPVVIRDKVWIGMGSLILPGVTVGEGAIVAGGSVVVKDVEPYTIVGGNPASFISRIEH